MNASIYDSLWAPGSIAAPLHRAEAPARHTLHCRAAGTLGGVEGGTVDLLLPPAAQTGAPFLLLIHPPPPPQWKDRWTVTWKVEADQISVFLRERRINGLGVVLGLELISVPVQAGDGPLPETGRRLQSFGHAALCVTCQVLFVIGLCPMVLVTR